MRSTWSLVIPVLIAHPLWSQSGRTDVQRGAGGTGCTELFFSEYIEGSGNNKALEIYNPGLVDIDLTGYTVELYSNGSATATNTYAMTGILPSHQVIVLANSQADSAILAQASATPSVCNFNGDDALVLKNAGVIIDVIGEVGVDPGTNWPVDAGSTLDHTLVRNVSVDGPDATWSTAQFGWTSHAQNYFDDLGVHTCVCSTGTGQAEVSGLPALRFYPLPATTSVTMECTGTFSVEHVLLVLDLYGRVVLRDRMTAQQQVIDVGTLATGTYQVQVVTSAGPTFAGRFVVAR